MTPDELRRARAGLSRDQKFLLEIMESFADMVRELVEARTKPLIEKIADLEQQLTALRSRRDGGNDGAG
jgi:hypothetical protein